MGVSHWSMETRTRIAAFFCTCVSGGGTVVDLGENLKSRRTYPVRN